MAPKIAINGLGRMGKLLLRELFDNGAAGEIVLINEPFGDLEQLALLLEFDTVHGRWAADISTSDGQITINGTTIPFTQETSIEALPLAENGVDLVVDCTGVFKTDAKVAPAALQKALSTVVPATFNQISVDGDTSTNDTVLLLASGLSGAEIAEGTPDYDTFVAALTEVAAYLEFELRNHPQIEDATPYLEAVEPLRAKLEI